MGMLGAKLLEASQLHMTLGFGGTLDDILKHEYAPLPTLLKEAFGCISASADVMMCNELKLMLCEKAPPIVKAALYLFDGMDSHFHIGYDGPKFHSFLSALCHELGIDLSEIPSLRTLRADFIKKTGPVEGDPLENFARQVYANFKIIKEHVRNIDSIKLTNLPGDYEVATVCDELNPFPLMDYFAEPKIRGLRS